MSEFVRTYTLTFYVRGENAFSSEESFTEFISCVLKAKELIYSKGNFGMYNCLIKWKDDAGENNSLRCDSFMSGYRFKRCLGGKEEKCHLYRLDDIWGGA